MGLRRLHPQGDMKYKAYERAWVARLLARLNSDQRRRYEEEMRKRSGHYSTGKKYDGLKAEVAERILYEDALKPTEPLPAKHGAE